MPLIAGVVGAGALSSFIGGKQAAKESAAARAQAADFTNKAIAALEKVGIPEVEARKITLDTPKLVFQYVPELQKEFPEIHSKILEYQEDPRLQQVKSEMISELQKKSEVGFTPEEMAEIAALRRGTAQQAVARDASIQQGMEQRGLADSGTALLMRLNAGQQATQQASIDTENMIKSQAEARLAALNMLGQEARAQDAERFAQASQKAQLEDVYTRLNQAARYDVQAANVAERNKAQLGRQELAQQLENQRVATANQEQIYNKELQQERFQNEMAKAGAAASAYTGAANSAIQAGANAAANKQAMWQGIGQAGMGGAQLYGAAQDRQLKQDQLAFDKQQAATKKT